MAYTRSRKRQQMKKSGTRRMRCQKGGTNNDITIVGILHDLRIIVVANVKNNNLCSELDYVNHDTDITFQDPPGDPQNFAFEYSSGTSNPGENFPNTFLPIRRYQLGNGSNLLKTPSIHMLKKGNFVGEYGMTSELYIFNYIIEQIPDNCRDSAYRHLKYFAARFGCWKELQISAALGGGAWDSDYLELKLLKKFVLSHDCIPITPITERKLPDTVENPDYYKKANCHDQDDNEIFPYYFCKRNEKLNTFDHETMVPYDYIEEPPNEPIVEGVEENRKLMPAEVEKINSIFDLNPLYKQLLILPNHSLPAPYELNSIEKLKSCFIKYYAYEAMVIKTDPVKFSAIIQMPAHKTYNIRVANKWFKDNKILVYEDELSDSIRNYIRNYRNTLTYAIPPTNPMRALDKKKYPYHTDNMFNWKICNKGDMEDKTIEKKCNWKKSNKRLKLSPTSVSVTSVPTSKSPTKSAVAVRKSVRKTSKKNN
jgi:hypothetical protein